MSTARKLIVTGATGKQGGALIKALLAKPSQPFEIYAVTRNINSASAQKLASNPKVHVVAGNFDAPSGIFAQVPQPWGLFAMSDLTKGHKIEEEQGKALSKAAFDAGIKHIVFTATERGGQEKSDSYPTPIPHFISKFNIEQDIKARAATSNGTVTWTFLRPVAFMENLGPNFFGKVFVSSVRLNGEEHKLQLISTSDIGKVAAEAFLHADEEEYRNKGISIAGDEVSAAEMTKVFKEVTGQTIPETYAFISWILQKLSFDFGSMFRWFKTDGFGVNVAAVRKRYPFMKDFKTWLEQESSWKR